MPTPIGHALAGVAVGAALSTRRPFLSPGRDLVMFALLAQVPDLDFIPGILVGRPDAYHHGISHSLATCLLLGLVTGFWGWKRRAKAGSPPGPGALAWGVMGFLVVFSHLLLDGLNLDTKAPYGLPIWWPLSSQYHLFYPLLPDVWREAPWWPTIKHNLWAVCLEVLLLAPPAGLALWLRRRGYLKRGGDP